MMITHLWYKPDDDNLPHHDIIIITRFYDPSKGHVLLDGVPYKDINLKALRSHIGYVGQGEGRTI